MHNSFRQSLIAQGSEYPLKKPAGFHWDFFLLGCTTFIAGLLGIPAPNGLIPQAPLHTASLVVMGYEKDSEASSITAVSGTDTPTHQGAPTDEHQVALSDLERGDLPRTMSGGEKARGRRRKRRLSIGESITEAQRRRKALVEENLNRREVPVAVVEQRISNLAQGSLCKRKVSQAEVTDEHPGLILMTKPFEHVLGLIPKGVLAGLFVRRLSRSDDAELLAVVYGL